MMIWAGAYLNCAVFGALYRPILPKHKKQSKQKVLNLSTATTVVNEEQASSLLKDQYLQVKEMEQQQQTGVDVEGSVVNDICDLSPLRNTLFLLYCIGTLVANLGVMPFFQHTPGRALFVGVDRHKVVYLPTVIGTCTALSRILFGFIANFRCVNRTLMYSVSVIVGGCVLTSYSLATTFPVFILYCVVIGSINGKKLTLYIS